MNTEIGMFCAVCEEDKHLIPMFLEEARRLEIPVAFYSDKLSPETISFLNESGVVVGIYEGQGVFSEMSKEKALNILKEKGFKWAIQIDIDETWELDAREKILKTLENCNSEIIDVPMINIIDQDGELFIRDDFYYSEGREKSRERIYNLAYDYHWIDHFTNGPKLFKDNKMKEDYVPGVTGATTVHWGYINKERRYFHALRWDRVYGYHGRNPYAKYKIFKEEHEKEGEEKVQVRPLTENYYKHLKHNPYL